MSCTDCKHEERINRLDREQGETKISLVALVTRVDRLTQVAISVGMVLLVNVMATLGFLISFWVKGT